jgi:CPA1 family monovalent cation:H+ antiporter
LVMPFTLRFLYAGLAAIAVTLLARWASVGGTIGLMRPWRRFEPGTVTVLTWGGLRGGLSVALALALPPGGSRDLILAATYCVVVFSIFGQGLTAATVIRRVSPACRHAAARDQGTLAMNVQSR